MGHRVEKNTSFVRFLVCVRLCANYFSSRADARALDLEAQLRDEANRSQRISEQLERRTCLCPRCSTLLRIFHPTWCSAQFSRFTLFFELHFSTVDRLRWLEPFVERDYVWAYNRAWLAKRSVFKYLSLNIKLEFLSNFPGSPWEIRVLERTRSLVAHSDEKSGGRDNGAPYRIWQFKHGKHSRHPQIQLTEISWTRHKIALTRYDTRNKPHP